MITAVAIEAVGLLGKTDCGDAVWHHHRLSAATACHLLPDGAQGYNLYNVGFAAGLVGTLLVSVMKSFGFEISTTLMWTYENDWRVVAYILLLSLTLLLTGLFSVKNKSDIRRIYRHSGSSGGRLHHPGWFTGHSVQHGNAGHCSDCLYPADRRNHQRSDPGRVF